MKEIHIDRQPWARGKCRPKLDLRLATLLELGPEAFAAHLDKLERSPRVKREGPLAFLGGSFGDPRREGASAPPFVSVFLTATEPAALDRLSQRIANPKARFDRERTRLLSRSGDVATAQIALDDMKKVEDDPDVVAIEWTGAVRPASASVDIATGAFAPRSAIGLDEAPPDLDGRGTVIGIIDLEGLDLYHPSFVDENGRSRVHTIWDQRGKPPAEQEPTRALPTVPYGVVYDRETIDRETSPKQLLAGDVVRQKVWKGSHGTMTAGLAAGLGGALPEAKGIAPGAQLVFVNTYGSGVGALGAMTELADALSFVFQVAEDAGRPCVVNLSMGDDLGPRDGSSPVERFIEGLLAKPGRAVVIAAGNSADNGRRARVRFEGAKPETLSIDVGAGNFDRAVIEIWYRTTEGRGGLEIELEAPGDGGRTTRIRSDGIPRVFGAADVQVLVAAASRVPGRSRDGGTNGLVRIEVLSTKEDAPLLAGMWRIHLFPQGDLTEAHAFMDHRYAKFVGGDQGIPTSLTTPATSRRAITVGAWDPVRKRVFFFSGRGPCRDGVSKPDLVAPGGPLVAASATTTTRYVPASGTSMAAPLVTGAVALLFQREKRLIPSDEVLPGLFPAGAGRRDEETGFGVLDLAHWFTGAEGLV